MPKIERLEGSGQRRWLLDGRELHNGDVIEVRLHGNRGWEEVTVEGLPDTVRIRFAAWDGKELLTTLPFSAEAKWSRTPDRPELRRQDVQTG